MISLEDQHALQDLHNRYVHATDRGDYTLLRSLYTEDAIENHGDYTGPVDGFIKWLPQAAAYFESTTHMVSNLLIRVNGGAVESEGRGTAYLRLKGEPSFNMIVINRLFDSYKKIDGLWLFHRRALSVDWVQQFSPGDADLDLTSSIPSGTNGPDDPVYHNIPALVASLRKGLPPIK
ncbi:nuclear transport factor 2 family protein [Kineobactrum salinum]|uniref:Nuclear transport factor 2 family protein n=1 Tax=Kineobactrum salinum TaxID=2708301 RepID=A0A6C0U3Z6_9GAMM|nr:nuclear transport factor 2 family protein [Kineobactrum salinum]QIB66831.1 nuclear transport factor 2 family protein [Kineobactrum salinum]